MYVAFIKAGILEFCFCRQAS